MSTCNRMAQTPAEIAAVHAFAKAWPPSVRIDAQLFPVEALFAALDAYRDASTPTPAPPPAAAESVTLREAVQELLFRTSQVDGMMVPLIRYVVSGERPSDDWLKAFSESRERAWKASKDARAALANTASAVAAGGHLGVLRDAGGEILVQHGLGEDSYDPLFIDNLRAALTAAGQATPSEPADRRRERLLDERHRLENSYGNTPARDGQIRDRIAEIDAQLAGHSSQGAPTDE